VPDERRCARAVAGDQLQTGLVLDDEAAAEHARDRSPALQVGVEPSVRAAGRVGLSQRDRGTTHGLAGPAAQPDAAGRGGGGEHVGATQ
jgi:hypothetical protein